MNSTVQAAGIRTALLRSFYFQYPFYDPLWPYRCYANITTGRDYSDCLYTLTP